MAKYKDGNFIQLSRSIFEHPELSINAKWLYCVLSELEHTFTGKDKDWFFRSDIDLAKDSGLSRASVARAKRELITAGLIKLNKARYKTSDGRKSTFALSAYTILA